MTTHDEGSRLGVWRGMRALGWLALVAALAWLGGRTAQQLQGASPARTAGATVVATHGDEEGRAAVVPASAPPPASTSSAAKERGERRATPPCGEEERVPGAVLADGRVVLNLAGAGDLRGLPGVGPKRARAILELRSRLGRFRSLRDLLRVKGLGVRRLRQLEPRLLLERPAEAKAPPEPAAENGKGA